MPDYLLSGYRALDLTDEKGKPGTEIYEYLRQLIAVAEAKK